MEFDLQEGFPLMTTKKVPMRLVAEELFWMLSGSTNVKPLQEKNVHIWDEWADENGELGPVYGSQFRDWKAVGSSGHPNGRVVDHHKNIAHIDQLSELIQRIKDKPDCRRLIVSAWNVGEIHKMKLPPCHCFFQVNIRKGKFLDLKLYQRSADLFLGVPFNIPSYALLMLMLAKETGYLPGKFIHSFGSAHIYTNHMEQISLQLMREPKELPAIRLNPDSKFFETTWDDIDVIGYDPHPAIKGKVSV